MKIGPHIRPLALARRPHLASRHFVSAGMLHERLSDVLSQGRSGHLRSHLYSHGVATHDVRHLIDDEVAETVLASRDLANRVAAAMEATSCSDTYEFSPPRPDAVNTWPRRVRKFFAKGLENPPWRSTSNHFVMEREIRAASRRLNHGELTYAVDMGEHERFMAAVFKRHKLGKRVARIASESERELIRSCLQIKMVPSDRDFIRFRPDLMGLELVRGVMEPGDILSDEHMVYGAILTKVTKHDEAAETLNVIGRGLYVLHPSVVGSPQYAWRFDPQKIPYYIIVGKEHQLSWGPHISPEIARLRTMVDHLDFSAEKFRVLSKEEAPKEDHLMGWPINFRFSNGDMATIYLRLNSRACNATIIYEPALPEDPPDFIEAAETALTQLARQHGLDHMQIIYKDIFIPPLVELNPESRDTLHSQNYLKALEAAKYRRYKRGPFIASKMISLTGS